LDFNILLENKLKAKDRKTLDSEDFGLPKDRKFPLIDEEHIIQAIRFFRYCPASKKFTLAKNINKKSKEYNLKINISEKNPFYKLADKSIIKECVSCSSDECSLTDMELPEEFLKYASINNYLKQMIKELNTFIPSSLDEVYDFEKKFYDNLYRPFINEVVINSLNNNTLYFIQILNNFIEKIIYERGFEYILFIGGKGFNYIESIKLQKSMIEDFCFMIYSENSIEENEKYLSLLKDMLIQNSDNFFLVIRRIYLLYIDGLKLITEVDIKNITKNLRNQTEILNSLLRDFISDNDLRSAYKHSFDSSNDRELDYEQFLDLNMKNTEEFLRKKSVELKDLSRSMLTKFNLSLGINFFNDMKEFFLQELPRNNKEISFIIGYLEGSLNPKFIKYYDKNYTLKLDDTDLLFINKLKDIFTGIYNSTDINGDIIYYGIGENRLYLLAKNKIDSNEIILIKLYGSSVEININSLVTGDVRDLKTMDMKIVYINKQGLDNQYNNKILTEGISIEETGDIKFSFKPKKSYMDDYSENHKLLIENFKSKNYEAMKHNLAYLFALINSIERDVIYKKKNINSEKLKDAQKARAFAINDFKTYLKEIQKNEKDFDFTKYFENGGYDTFVYNINTKSILGVKKLFQIIMFG